MSVTKQMPDRLISGIVCRTGAIDMKDSSYLDSYLVHNILTCCRKPISENARFEAHKSKFLEGFKCTQYDAHTMA